MVGDSPNLHAWATGIAHEQVDDGEDHAAMMPVARTARSRRSNRPRSSNRAPQVEMAHYGNYNDARQSAPSMRELRLYGNVLKGGYEQAADEADEDYAKRVW